MGSRGSRIDTLQTVELAEGMEIHLRVAGPLLRLLAFLADGLIRYVLVGVLGGVVIPLLLPALGDNVTSAIQILTIFFVWWFYGVFFEMGKRGATPGKRLCGLRVVNEAGGGITMGQAMIRNFIRGAEVLLPLVPLLMFFHPRFQRLGDLAAGTLVVYSRPRVDPVAPSIPPMKAVPVGLALSREEEAAILSYRYRSGGWSEARRIELANHLGRLVGINGSAGVAKVLGMARWLEEQR